MKEVVWRSRRGVVDSRAVLLAGVEAARPHPFSLYGFMDMINGNISSSSI
jgi:hypothetical protein